MNYYQIGDKVIVKRYINSNFYPDDAIQFALKECERLHGCIKRVHKPNNYIIAYEIRFDESYVETNYGDYYWLSTDLSLYDYYDEI